jgi:hypothetical protein
MGASPVKRVPSDYAVPTAPPFRQSAGVLRTEGSILRDPHLVGGSLLVPNALFCILYNTLGFDPRVEEPEYDAEFIEEFIDLFESGDTDRLFELTLGCPELGKFDPPSPFSVVSVDDDGKPHWCTQKVLDILARQAGSDCPPPNIGCRDCGEVDAVGTDVPQIIDQANAEPADFDLIRKAWNLLISNRDIVHWVVCLIEGEGNADCVVERLFDDSNPVEIHFEDHDKWGGWAWVLWPGKNIHINVHGSDWVDVRHLFTTWPAGSPLRFCAVSQTAVLLLHELLHGCLSVFNSTLDHPNRCFATYMVQNAFAWAVGQRYRCVTCSDTCGYYARDCTWFNDDASVGEVTWPSCTDLLP